jgi:hypothetical protein
MGGAINGMKDQITEIVGRTWFSFGEDRETYFLRSREYGDVCEEEPGKQDIEEANRLIGLLRKAGHKVSGDVVDEWVEVIIRKQNVEPWKPYDPPRKEPPQPRTPYEKKQMAMYGEFYTTRGPKGKLP